MSFSNPATFAVLKDAKAGETYEITTGKNDKDYTVWTQAVKASVGAAAANPPQAGAKAAWVPDADRQRLIVKQSSLSNAVALLKEAHARGEVSVAEVKNLADEFVQYVYDVPALETETE